MREKAILSGVLQVQYLCRWRYLLAVIRPDAFPNAGIIISVILIMVTSY